MVSRILYRLRCNTAENFVLFIIVQKMLKITVGSMSKTRMWLLDVRWLRNTAKAGFLGIRGAECIMHDGGQIPWLCRYLRYLPWHCLKHLQNAHSIQRATTTSCLSEKARFLGLASPKTPLAPPCR